jgi:hypothetical protein
MNNRFSKPSPFTIWREEAKSRRLTTRPLKPTVSEGTEDSLKPRSVAKKTLSIFERLELGMLGPSVSQQLLKGAR